MNWYKIGKYEENQSMKKLFIISTLAILFVCPSMLMAQKGKPIFGGNVIAGVPSGELRNGYKSVFGIEGMGGIGVAKNLYVMGTIGFNQAWYSHQVSLNKFALISIFNQSDYRIGFCFAEDIFPVCFNSTFAQE